MELQGRIIAVLEPRTGTNAKGPWMAQAYVLEVPGEYPKKMCFDVFGEERNKRFAPLADGSMVRVSFDIDAHEYQGRWYNSIRAYDIRPADSGNDGGSSSGSAGGGYPQPCPPQAQPQVQAQPQGGGGSGVYYRQDIANSSNSLPF